MLYNTDLEKKINSELNTKVSSSKIAHQTLNISIEKDDLKEVILFLKSNPDMKFKQLIDITAVDYPNKKNRFRMVYLLLSHELNKRTSFKSSFSIETFNVSWTIFEELTLVLSSELIFFSKSVLFNIIYLLNLGLLSFFVIALSRIIKLQPREGIQVHKHRLEQLYRIL